MWKYTGAERPDFAEQPGPGQESVWDYPRPPALVATSEAVEVWDEQMPIAVSQSALRMLETASPPTYYLPSRDVDWRQLVPVEQTSFCEWKGRASYFALASAPERGVVAWRYENPAAAYAAIDDHVSFYPAKLRCLVNGEQVRAQPGGFYGGWVTDRIAGPIKGAPGTGHW